MTVTGGKIRLPPYTSPARGVVFKRMAATQVEDILAAADDTLNPSTEVIYWRIAGTGYMLVNAPNSAPADAELLAGEFAPWLDDTVSAVKVMVKAKDSAGTVVSQELVSKARGDALYATAAQGATADAAVPKALYDANTILAATTDNTPAAVTMGASTILARLATGDIIAATPSQLRTLLSLVPGTDVQAFDDDLLALATAFARATASGPASLALLEDTDNGSNKVTIIAPASMASDRVFTLPDVTTSPVTTEHGGLETIQSHGSTGSTETIDLANGNVHTAAQDQACTYTLSGFTNGKACSLTLILTSVTGAATWPAAVKWPDATAPTLSGVTIITFLSTDGGTTIYGFPGGKAFA